MKSIKYLVLWLCLLFFLVPLQANAETLEEQLNHLVGPTKQYNTMLSPVYLNSNKTEESISPQSGELTLTQTDYVLPGRNGLDLEIKRIYKSNTSTVQEMKVKYVSGAWVDYVHSDERTSTFYEDRYNLGIGMRFSFPSIEVKENQDGTSYLFLHTENGDVYRLRAVLMDDLLTYLPEGQTVRDVLVRESAAYDNGQSDGKSKYVMTDKSGRKTYFASDGRILAMMDRFDNTIKFEYETLSYQKNNTSIEKRLIHKITDTVGRVVTIAYQEDHLFKVGKIENTAYTKENSHLASQNPNTVDSGELQEKFQVVITVPGNKTLSYDKSAALINDQKEVLRTRLQRVYDLDGSPKYHFWYEQPELGFTFMNGNTYAAYNRHEKLVQIDYRQSDRLKRYSYNTYTQSLNEGSMQYRKLFETQELVKKDFTPGQTQFMDQLVTEVKGKETYAYTNEPDGYGHTGYQENDYHYLENTYRYQTKITDLLGRTLHYAYDGLHQLKEIENTGADHKEIIHTERDHMKLVKLQKRLIYPLNNGQPGTTPVVEMENYRYDEYGNLTNYTGKAAARDENGEPLNSDHTVTYAYDYDRFHLPLAKTWKRDAETTSQILYTLSDRGEILRETQINTQDESRWVMKDHEYDTYGNLIKTTVQSQNQSFTTHYEYGIDGAGADQKGAYLTQVYQQAGSQTIGTRYGYDFNTGNLTMEMDMLGHAFLYLYDALNRMIKKTRPDGSEYGFTYGSQPFNSFQIEETDPLGNVFLYEYDTLGNLLAYGLKQQGQRQILEAYEYDARGNLVKETDANGHSIRYVYDSNSRLISKSYWEQDRIKKGELTLAYQIGYAEDTPLRLLLTDEEGYEERYDYDILNRLIRRSYTPDKSAYDTESYAYDFVGNLLTLTDARGAVTSHEYDDLNRLVNFIDALGYETSFEYNGLHQQIRAVEPAGKVTEMAYDQAGRLVESRVYLAGDEEKSLVRQAYDQANNVTRKEEGALTAGGETFHYVTEYAYDAMNRLTDEYQPIDENRRTHKGYTYDLNGNLVQVRQWSDEAETQYLATEYTYDFAGRFLNEKQFFVTPGNTQLAARVGVYEVVQERDWEGNVIKRSIQTGQGPQTTTFTYNNRNQVLEQRQPFTPQQERVTRFAYDLKGNLVSESLELSNETLTTSYTYNGQGLVLSQVNPLGEVQRYVYDANGNLLKRVDPRYAALSVEAAPGLEYEYDLLNRQSKLIDFNGTTRQVVGLREYDGRGNLVKETGGEGYHPADPGQSFGLLYQYDALNRVTEKVSAQRAKENRQTGEQLVTAQYAYDIRGNVIAETDARGNQTVNRYWGNGLLREKTYADGSKQSYEYDLTGRLYAAETNQAGYQTKQWRTLFGAPYAIEYPDGTGVRFEYNGKGELVAAQDQVGNWKYFEYDGQGNQLVQKEWIESREGGDTYKVTQSAYDQRGLLLTRETFLLESRGQQQTLISAENKVIYQYDGAGRLLQRAGPQGRELSLEYDRAGNLLTETEKVTEQEAEVKRYTYDHRSRLLTESLLVKSTHLEAGHLAGAAFDNQYYDRVLATTAFTYNLDGLPIEQRDANGHVTRLELDLDGRPVKRVNPTGDTLQYGYDGQGNLVEQVDGNGASSYYEYDAMNRLIRSIQPSAQNTPAITRYLYDVRGNLVKIIQPNQYEAEKDIEELAGQMQGAVYTYDSMNRRTASYDPTGRLVELIEYTGLGQPGKLINGLAYTGSAANSPGTTFTYNGLGQAISVTTPLGETTTYAYDVLGNIINKTDPKGATTTWVYAGDGTLTKETDALGGQKQYTYDRKGRKVSETDPRDQITTYAYNEFGNLREGKDPLQNTVVYRYDLAGNLISQRDKGGSTTYFSYDAANRVIEKQIPLELDASGNVVYLIERYEYDPVGNLTKKTVGDSKGLSPSREQRYTYYSNRLAATLADNSGGFTRYAYDLNGNLIQKEVAKNETEWDVEQYGFDSQNKMIQWTALVTPGEIEKGETYTWLLDANPDKLRLTTSYEYDVLGNQTSVTDPLGNRVAYTYDLLSRVTEISRELDDQEVKQLFEYDAAGNQIKKIDEKGNVTQYRHDALNRLTTIIDPLGYEFTFGYDESGNKISETNALGNAMTYAYDELNRVTSVTDAYQQVIIRNTYDEKGNLIKIQDGKGYETRRTYDLANRLVEVVDPEAAEAGRFTIRYAYLPTGELKSETDPLGYTKAYEYDQAGRLTAVIDQQGVATRYGYDRSGNRLFMQDGRGKLTRYQYGSFGKLLAVINAEGQTNTYQYGLNGNQVLEIDRKSNHLRYTYDSRNLLLKKAVSETGDQISFTYDAAGNRETMTDESGTTRYVYDAAHRLIEKIKDNQTEIRYAYDAVGNLERVTDSKGFTTSYTYDKSNRMKTVGFNGEEAVYEYDANGNRIALTYPGGIKETYTLNKNNQLVTLINKREDGSEISRYEYTYDANQRQISKTDSYGTTRYTYDPAGRIKEVEAPGKTTRYTYDQAGNRLSMEEIHISNQPSGYLDQVTGESIEYKIKRSDYVYNHTNQLLKLIEKMQEEEGKEVLQKTTNYQYDPNGNQVRQAVSYLLPHNRQMRQSSAGDIHGDNQVNNQESSQTDNPINNQTADINTLIEKVSSSFDGFNRLKRMEKIKGGERVTVSYVYNGDGLRTQKTSRSSKDSYEPIYTNYQYDRQHVILETDQTGAITARYIRGINYLARYDSNEEAAYYLYNGHGDVVQTVSKTGEVLNQYDYDIFGNPLLQIEEHENAIRYAGEFYDAETGLYYLRARYYDPYTGRFISEDSYWGEDTNPLSLNLYTYAYNDPIRFVDPSGHTPRTIADIIVEIDQAKREWTAEDNKRDKSLGYDGWTDKQKEANNRANQLREELARLEKNSQAAQTLVSQKGDDAGTWAEYKKEAKRKEIEEKGTATPYDIYEFSRLDAMVDLERELNRSIDPIKDNGLIEKQLTKSLGVNVSVDRENNITFKDKNVVWNYVGMDVYEASQQLMSAGTVRNAEASKGIRETDAFTAMTNAQKNRKLDLNAKELEFLYHMDEHGTKDYLTSLPSDGKKRKEEKEKLREEVFVALTGRDPKYYQNSGFGWVETKEGRKGDIFNTVWTEADILLSREDGMPKDLADAVLKPVTIATSLVTVGLMADQMATYLKGMETFGFKNATNMFNDGSLRGNLDYYESLNSTTKLYRVMSEGEYNSLIKNGQFTQYDKAMESKWFATNSKDAAEWGKKFYPNGNYKMVEIEVPTNSLNQMYHVNKLDGIGPAYNAERDFINSVIKSIREVIQ